MEGIYVVDPEGLKEKLSKFKANNFHIISDFDSTLTKAFIDGEKVVSFYSYLRKNAPLSDEYLKKSWVLYDHYRPIEFNLNTSQEEKNEKMAEWWSKHYDLMIQHGMNKNVIEKLIKIDKLKLRDNSIEFFNLLAKNKTPLLILSASMGNFVEGFLKSKNVFTENVHLVSNFMVFDDEGKAVSYVRPLIHTFNKKEVQIRILPYKKDILEKKNVILLGDVPGDAEMCEGIGHDSIIKIGFLNENVKELIEDYKKIFDVVILNDGPMDYVNGLLKEILG